MTYNSIKTSGSALSLIILMRDNEQTQTRYDLNVKKTRKIILLTLKYLTIYQTTSKLLRVQVISSFDCLLRLYKCWLLYDIVCGRFTQESLN